jgi:integrase
MSYGDGTIRRTVDGRLEVRCSIGGRMVYRHVPARMVRLNPKEARRRAESIQRDLQRLRDADVFPSSQTLADYLRSWVGSLRDAKRKRVRARTMDGYEMIVERHIVPALGHVRLDALKARQVQVWIDGMDAEPRTVERRLAVLRRALNVAVKQEIIPANPATKVELPEPETFVGDPLTFAEVHRFFEANADDPLLPLWRLAIDSGCRQAELLGLAWDDLDLEQGTVTVTSQLQSRGGGWLRLPLKADRAITTLTLDADTVESLRKHRVSQAALREPDWVFPGLVFINPDERDAETGLSGLPWKSWKVLRRFHASLKRAGLRKRRFHDLRTTSATLMRTLGVPEDLRQARLGHATTRMARHYALAETGIDREAATRLGDAIRSAV